MSREQYRFLTVHEIGIRREVGHRLDATFKVLSAKIGKYGSATHHLANVLGDMSLAFIGSLSHWPEVVEYAGKLAAAVIAAPRTRPRSLPLS